MTKDRLEEIKRFAEENFCADEGSQIYGDDEEFAVTNPWIDHTGRFALTDEGAVKEWGLDVLLDFIEKSKIRMLQDRAKTGLCGFVFRNAKEGLWAWQVELSEEDERKIWEILSKYETDGCSVSDVYNSKFSEAF